MDHLDVPVRPHVLKFLQHYLGGHYVLSENDQFGSYLYLQMRRPMRDSRRDHLLEDYAGRWKLHFGGLSPKKHGLRLTGKGALKFNKFVNDVLETELFGYVDYAVRYGNKIKYAIEEYTRERNITEEDIQFETLYKRYQRYCQERRATRKRTTSLRQVRPEQDVRKDLLRMPLPVAPSARPTA